MSAAPLDDSSRSTATLVPPTAPSPVAESVDSLFEQEVVSVSGGGGGGGCGFGGGGGDSGSISPSSSSSADCEDDEGETTAPAATLSALKEEESRSTEVDPTADKDAPVEDEGEDVDMLEQSGSAGLPAPHGFIGGIGVILTPRREVAPPPVSERLTGLATSCGVVFVAMLDSGWDVSIPVFEHQVRAVARAVNVYTTRRGFITAHEMGLGKTCTGTITAVTQRYIVSEARKQRTATGVEPLVLRAVLAISVAGDAPPHAPVRLVKEFSAAATQKLARITGTRTLIFAPLSVLRNWVNEIERFFPRFRGAVGIAHGTQLGKIIVDTRYAFIVTTHDMLKGGAKGVRGPLAGLLARRAAQAAGASESACVAAQAAAEKAVAKVKCPKLGVFKELCWPFVIIDESDVLRNKTAQRHKQFKTFLNDMRCKEACVLLLSGTPVHADDKDLHSLASLIWEESCLPAPVLRPSPEDRVALIDAFKHFRANFMSVEKFSTILDLPEMSLETRCYHLTPKQENLYDFQMSRVTERYYDLIRHLESPSNTPEYFLQKKRLMERYNAANVRLQMIAIHPMFVDTAEDRNLDAARAGTGGKEPMATLEWLQREIGVCGEGNPGAAGEGKGWGEPGAHYPKPQCRCFDRSAMVAVNKHKTAKAFVDLCIAAKTETHPGFVSPAMRAYRVALNEYLTAGSSVIIQSQWPSILSLFRGYTTSEFPGIKTVEINGKISGAARAAAAKEIQEGTARVLFLSLRTAKGLNLTRCNVVIEISLFDNPQEHWQGRFRVHRIGQTKPTTTLMLGAVSKPGRGTIFHAIQRKHALRMHNVAVFLHGKEDKQGKDAVKSGYQFLVEVSREFQRVPVLDLETDKFVVVEPAASTAITGEAGRGVAQKRKLEEAKERMSKIRAVEGAPVATNYVDLCGE